MNINNLNKVINSESLSFSEIFSYLKAFLDSRPDSAKWADFFASGAGYLILETIAGMSAYNSFTIITAIREVMLDYAQRRSSVIGHAYSKGYDVFRGQNMHLTLNILPDQNINIYEFDVVGTYEGYDIVSLEDKAIKSGVANTLSVVLGLKKEVSILAETSNITTFRFKSNKVSEDIKVYVDSSEVSLNTDIYELINGHYIPRSNSYGGVNILSLNNGDITYTAESEVILSYIELANMEYNLSSVNFNYGLVNSADIDSNYIAVEDIEIIRVNAPLYAETSLKIRGRADFKKNLKIMDLNLVDVNDRDVSPVVIEITYIKNDKSLYDSFEKEYWVNQIMAEDKVIMGIEPPTVVDPEEFTLNLNIEITKSSNAIINLDNDIREILSNYEMLLEKEVDLEAIENSLTSEISVVKISRVSIDVNDWSSDTLYSLGTFVSPTTPNGYIYECVVSGTSSPSEPSWGTTEGETTVDNTATWKCYIDSTTTVNREWNHYNTIVENVTVI